MQSAGYIARVRENRNAYRILVGRTGEKRFIGRHRRSWENDIKMDVKE
jgi:hypothetical protein